MFATGRISLINPLPYLGGFTVGASYPTLLG
jgi:hypothetical protein